MDQNKSLYNTVIKNDYCIGCGACSFVNSDYKVQYDSYGMLKATTDDLDLKNGNSIDKALNVCPFSDNSPDEDTHTNRIFDNSLKSNRYIGKYLNNYVGYVSEGEFRSKGSSGGFGKWILNELLKRNEVDYVIQVITGNDPGKLYQFQVFQKGDDILGGSKSAYYPVTLVEALDFIKKNKGRYAITSIPCFSKAIRNICLQDSEMNEKIKYVVGIICGHLKSTGFAESLAWQLEVEPKNLRGIEFRDKIEGLNANEKGVWARDEKGVKSVVMSSKELLGGNWGHGFFKYKACDYCDDIVGETTDVSVGDAWIKELMSDHEGNNVVIIRNKKIDHIVTEAISKGRLNFQNVDEKIVVNSQAGGIRHRREGLSYRLYLKEKSGSEWCPKKRVSPSNSMPKTRKKIYRVREKLRDQSHVKFKEAKAKNDLKFFEVSMRKKLKKLNPSLLERLEYNTKRTIVKFLKSKR
ncbi:Coenzyme F420 hydrogenase/dehydrogenase, beta subunit C-terminal domain [uncultured Christiangramia sp.]|uniref:Coenzyme F420 hydrogenase/dehydrogenase, beta subunit C-terminal domain n=1 Tax=uncultured Christiangramia sp. TaxID=503836 RepID=UPI002604871D|nr:Coenzyme F420 hydrogenase/dehydrogenase, beta subunit C-terminal domain [uncultured Christiangramia sp.]